MTSPNMYISPGVIAALVAIFMALLAVGGVLWKLANIIGDVKTNVAVMAERLDGHIKTCGPQKAQKTPY